jgi:glyoxylase I family protein
MPSLNVEHLACNVSDPAAMAAWYVEHLGMRIVRRLPTAPHIHFLADASGRVVIEIYCNAADPVPDYAAMHPLRFHVAFAADDPDAARAALVAAGATFVDEQTLADGSRLMMLRDPWGLAVQLCKRTTPLLPGSQG